MFLPRLDTLTAWISAGPCHGYQRAAQEPFTAGQLRQLRTSLPVCLIKFASMFHKDPFDLIQHATDIRKYIRQKQKKQGKLNENLPLLKDLCENAYP